MPLHDMHKKKKYKNYALLGLLVFFIAVFFTMTIVRMKQSNTVEIDVAGQGNGSAEASKSQ